MEETVSDSRTKYVVVADERCRGVFLTKSAALLAIREFTQEYGVGAQRFEIQAWRGRAYGGTYDYTGKLVHKANA